MNECMVAMMTMMIAFYLVIRDHLYIRRTILQFHYDSTDDGSRVIVYSLERAVYRMKYLRIRRVLRLK